MDEYTRLNITCGVDVAVKPAVCDALVCKLAVILEVDCENLFPTLNAEYLAHIFFHVGALLRREQKLGRGVHADGHIVEVPRKGAALAYQHIPKFIARHVKIVLARVAYRHAERDFIRVHKLYGVYGLFKVAVAAL